MDILFALKPLYNFKATGEELKKFLARKTEKSKRINAQIAAKEAYREQISRAKLAVAVVIDEIRPMANADKLELATVSFDGEVKQAVVDKGSFKEGETAVLLQAGAFLPLDGGFAHLGLNETTNMVTGKTGYRVVKTRIRQTKSEGILIKAPLPQVSAGDDLSASLGIEPWEMR